MTEATPRPWYLDKSDIRDAKGQILASCNYGGEICNRETAALIVRAVNAYDEREALLRYAGEHLPRWALDPNCGCHVCEEVRDFTARIRKTLGETE